MSFAKLSSQNMVYQTFNPQTTSTPNTDPSGLFPQFPGQHNFNPYSMPPMPMPPYPFQNNNPLMMNPMCPPQMNTQQNSNVEPTQQGQLPNGARRKNATRETTATLKAWLYEHRKNPYPTKGEKIMLAIITRMSLNQVSTWFANARRRLKKENKIGGSPKDLDDSDSEDMNNKNKKNSGNKVSGSTSSDNMNMDDLDDLDDLNDDVTDDEENENNISFNKEQKNLNNPQPIYPNFVPFNKFPSYPQFPLFKPQNLIENKKEETVVKKPKIWSIADVATKPTTPKTQPISPGRQLNVNLSSSSSSSSSCPSPMKNEQFLAAFSAVINQNSQATSIPASSSPSSTTSTLSNLSTDSPLLNYQQLYYQHLTSQFTNEFLRQSLYQQQQHQHQQQQQQILNNSSKCEISEMGAKDVNTSKNEQDILDDVKRVNKRELDDDEEDEEVEHESNSSFQSDVSNTNKKIKLSNESDLSNSSSSSLSSQLSPSLKRKLDDSD